MEAVRERLTNRRASRRHDVVSGEIDCASNPRDCFLESWSIKILADERDKDIINAILYCKSTTLL